MKTSGIGGLGIWVGMLAWAVVPLDAQAQRPRASEVRIEAALSELSSLDFIEQPLVDVIDYWMDLHEVEIQIDEAALADAGIEKDEPVTRRLDRIAMDSTLDLVLEPLGLTWTVCDEVILVTTPEVASRHLSTRLYVIDDLVSAQRPAAGAYGGGAFDPYGGAVMMGPPSGKSPGAAADILMAITTTIEPASWQREPAHAGATVLELGDRTMLVIRQTYRVHRDIGWMLDDLRGVVLKTPSKPAAVKPAATAPLKAAPSAKKPSPKPAAPARPAADPFGAPARKADPFGGGAKGADPFGGPSRPAADPFDPFG